MRSRELYRNAVRLVGSQVQILGMMDMSVGVFIRHASDNPKETEMCLLPIPSAKQCWLYAPKHSTRQKGIAYVGSWHIAETIHQFSRWFLSRNSLRDVDWNSQDSTILMECRRSAKILDRESKIQFHGGDATPRVRPGERWSSSYLLNINAYPWAHLNLHRLFGHIVRSGCLPKLSSSDTGVVSGGPESSNSRQTDNCLNPDRPFLKAVALLLVSVMLVTKCLRAISKGLYSFKYLMILVCSGIFLAFAVFFFLNAAA